MSKKNTERLSDEKQKLRFGTIPRKIIHEKRHRLVINEDELVKIVLRKKNLMNETNKGIVLS